MKLSALVVAHNEEQRLEDCLKRLTFADELVVVLDKCTDGSKAIAARYTDRLIEGRWDIEGERRNTGLDACRGEWILEVDADEHVPPALAAEIRQTVETSSYDSHLIPFDNYVGQRRVRYGWGGSFGTSAVLRLFRKGCKRWGAERVHPSLTITGRRGPILKNRVDHYVDRDLSDMIRRFDSYTTARARDLRDKGVYPSAATSARRVVSRFLRCYLRRGGWREGGYGFLIAIFAALYPLVSTLKARDEGH